MRAFLAVLIAGLGLLIALPVAAQQIEVDTTKRQDVEREPRVVGAPLHYETSRPPDSDFYPQGTKVEHDPAFIEPFASTYENSQGSGRVGLRGLDGAQSAGGLSGRGLARRQWLVRARLLGHLGRPARRTEGRSPALVTAPGWPQGARAACAFTFDLDAETLWMARGVTEPVALSQGTFGVREALPASSICCTVQRSPPRSSSRPGWSSTIPTPSRRSSPAATRSAVPATCTAGQ